MTFVDPGAGWGAWKSLAVNQRPVTIQLPEKGLQGQETAAGVTHAGTVQPPLSHTELMFSVFIHKLIVLSGQHMCGNVPGPGDLGCGHRRCRRLHWNWEAEGFPCALRTGQEERL